MTVVLICPKPGLLALATRPWLPTCLPCRRSGNIKSDINTQKKRGIDLPNWPTPHHPEKPCVFVAVDLQYGP